MKAGTVIGDRNVHRPVSVFFPSEALLGGIGPIVIPPLSRAWVTRPLMVFGLPKHTVWLIADFPDTIAKLRVYLEPLDPLSEQGFMDTDGTGANLLTPEVVPLPVKAIEFTTSPVFATVGAPRIGRTLTHGMNPNTYSGYGLVRLSFYGGPAGGNIVLQQAAMMSMGT